MNHQCDTLFVQQDESDLKLAASLVDANAPQARPATARCERFESGGLDHEAHRAASHPMLACRLREPKFHASILTDKSSFSKVLTRTPGVPLMALTILRATIAPYSYSTAGVKYELRAVRPNFIGNSNEWSRRHGTDQ